MDKNTEALVAAQLAAALIAKRSDPSAEQAAMIFFNVIQQLGEQKPKTRGVLDD